MSIDQFRKVLRMQVLSPTSRAQIYYGLFIDPETAEQPFDEKKLLELLKTGTVSYQKLEQFIAENAALSQPEATTDSILNFVIFCQRLRELKVKFAEIFELFGKSFAVGF